MSRRTRWTSISFLLVVAAAPAPAPGPPGFVRVDVVVPGSQQRIAVGDLDGDGDLDIIAMGTSPGAVPLTVVENTATGFLAGWSTSLGTQPQDPGDLDLGDLDLDGDLDVVASIALAVNQVRLNAGDGTFDVVLPLRGSNLRVQNELGQLDGDGVLDIASYDVDFIGYVGGHRGVGDGTFVEQICLPSSGSDYATRADLGDVNGDGLDDLVRASADGVHYTLGTPGSFPSWGPATEAWSDPAVDLEVADLDGDAFLDVVASIPFSGAIEVFLGQPSGLGFVSPFPGGPSPGPLAVADMDLDGDLDVILVNLGGSRLTVNSNDGNGVFLDLATFRGGRKLTDLAAADLDQDGDMDLVAASQAGRVSLFYNALIP